MLVDPDGYAAGLISTIIVALLAIAGVAAAGIALSLAISRYKQLGTSEAAWGIVWASIELAISLVQLAFAVVALVQAIRAVHFARVLTVSDDLLKDYKLDPRSIELAKQDNPSWGTFRKRVWKNEAQFHPGLYEDNLKRMARGLAPKVMGESMQLHHVVGKAEDLYDVIKVTPAEHRLIHKLIGYHQNTMWNMESLEEILYFLN